MSTSPYLSLSIYSHLLSHSLSFSPWSYSFTCHSGSLCSLLHVRLSERLNCIPPLLHSGLTCQKFSVYVDIFPGYYFCFHYDLYLLFLVIFHLTSMSSNSYSAPLLHMIFQHDILSHEYSVHTFSWSFSHPPLYTFPFLHLSLYLSLCVFMCTMCVRPSRVFFHWICVGCGDRLPVMVLPAALLYSGSLRPSSPVVSSQTQHPDLSAVNAWILCYMMLASSHWQLNKMPWKFYKEVCILFLWKWMC